MPDIIKTTVAAMLAATLATGALAQDAADGAAPETGGAAPEAGDAAPEAQAELGGNGETIGDAPSPGTQEGVLGLSMGQEQAQVGQTYIREEHGDWDVRCVRTSSGSDPCQLYQLLQDAEGNNVAEISVFPLPEGQEANAGATIITPLETLLTAQLALRVDDGPVKRYPFSWCSQVGCFSRVGFTDDDLGTFRRGAEATLTIRPVAAPDQTVDLGVSLSGFTAGFEAVTEINAASRQAAQGNDDAAAEEDVETEEDAE